MVKAGISSPFSPPSAVLFVNQENAKQIESTLRDDALVIDVGGGAAAFPRADWVIDALPYEDRGKLLRGQPTGHAKRFSRGTWVQRDLCDRQPWPFADKQFDYAICSHVLEDVRDPIWVCSEISRISRSGYIEVPSRAIEQSLGIEYPRLAGYHHHRWLVSVSDDVLEFRLKPHLLHVTRGAIVAKAGFWRTINPRHEITVQYWKDQIRCREVWAFDEQEIVRELCQCSQRLRDLPELLVKPSAPLADRLRRACYHLRLAWGWAS
jgi:hypothetical protein